jgi:hypothetical protein
MSSRRDHQVSIQCLLEKTNRYTSNTGIYVIFIFVIGDEKHYKKFHHSMELPQIADAGYVLRIRKATTSRHQTGVGLQSGGWIGANNFSP